MPNLRQQAYNSVSKRGPNSVKVSFTEPTLPQTFLVAVVTLGGMPTSNIVMPQGWQPLFKDWLQFFAMGIYVYPLAPAMESVTVSYSDRVFDASMQVRVLEYTGVLQSSNPIDKIASNKGFGYSISTGLTSNSAQADNLVLSFIANKDASTIQQSFRGGMSRLYDTTSPSQFGPFIDSNDDRTRLTLHQLLANAIGRWQILATVSKMTWWMAVTIVVKGEGVSGPRLLSSLNQSPMLDTDTGSAGGSAGANLSAFGPLKAGQNLVDNPSPPYMINTGWNTDPETQFARIGVFENQYRLGGWNGLLIGAGQNRPGGSGITVESTTGLVGWLTRTSDTDLPRGDGALRGVDLQAAREFQFNVNVGSNKDDVERNMAALKRALVPQRYSDWELFWRHPIGQLLMMRVRPIELVPTRDKTWLTYTKQTFTLRAADPRIYSAIVKKYTLPITSAGNAAAGNFNAVKVFNEGNSPAYPVLRIRNSTSSSITRVEIVNKTTGVTWAVEMSLTPGSTLIGDMESRVTGQGNRSPITVDGVSKYGAWLLPREIFKVEPVETGLGGYNEIYLKTMPAAAYVTATIEFRDTYYG